MNQGTQKPVKKLREPAIKVDERLNKFIGVDLFPEKTARADKYGAAVIIQDKSKSQ